MDQGINQVGQNNQNQPQVGQNQGVNPNKKKLM